MGLPCASKHFICPIWHTFALRTLLVSFFCLACASLAVSQSPDDQPIPASEPIEQPADKSDAQSASKPPVEPTAEPTAEPTVEPKAEATVEPKAEAKEEAKEEATEQAIDASIVSEGLAPTTDSTASAVVADQEQLPVVGTIGYQPSIQRIFQEHCSDCHGAKQSKADLRVDDRESLLSYIAPGDLESSSLWSDYLTTRDPESRMPPVKYGKPLSEQELATIRVWIEDGAQWPDSVVTLDNVPAAAQTVAAAETTASAPAANRNIVVKAWTFLGFFHPAVVHFPIGLLLISSLFVVLAFIKREAFEPAAFHCLWIGTVGAIVATLAGWAFAGIRGYGDFWHTSWNTDLIARHRISGVGVTGLAIVLSVVAFLARRRTSSDLRIVWLLGALCLAGMVSLVGHQGGELTYGEELFSRAYEQAFGPTVVEPIMTVPPAAAVPPATNAPSAALQQPAAALQQPAGIAVPVAGKAVRSAAVGRSGVD